MAQESPTGVLGAEIAARLQETSRKRLRDRRKAFGLKLGAALLGAAVTVLLGLKVSADHEATLKNIALVMGALVAVLNAWDAFYDHRALWVKRTTTTARLRKLDRAFRIACAARQDLDPKDIDTFRATLDQILDDDLSSWIQLRSDSPDKIRSADGTDAQAA
jgi:hypothetical protein